MATAAAAARRPHASVLHLMDAHEQSPAALGAAALDAHLARFVADALTKQPNSLVIVMGDHGMKTMSEKKRKTPSLLVFDTRHIGWSVAGWQASAQPILWH